MFFVAFDGDFKVSPLLLAKVKFFLFFSPSFPPFLWSQGEIDAHEDSFKAADESGQALLTAGHYASDEVKEKVQ